MQLLYPVVLLVYIWWRPAWMQRLYETAERKLVYFGYLLVGGMIAGLAVAACADALHEMVRRN